MKKIASILMVLSLLAAVPAQAQLKFGVKAGANIASMSGHSSDDLLNSVKNAASYQAGVLMQVGFGKFAIQPELIYSVKGASLSNNGSNSVLNAYGALTGNTVPNSLELQSSYLELPINLQYGFSLGSLARVYVQAGPYASYLVADKLKSDDNGFYDAYKQTLEELGGDPLNKLDYGVGVGAGVEVLFLQLAVKYDFGLAEMKEVTAAGADVNLFSGLKNRNLSISLGFLF